ncbi:hypothetical protein D9M68_905370 [compost metagenome]
MAHRIAVHGISKAHRSQRDADRGLDLPPIHAGIIGQHHDAPFANSDETLTCLRNAQQIRARRHCGDHRRPL